MICSPSLYTLVPITSTTVRRSETYKGKKIILYLICMEESFMSSKVFVLKKEIENSKGEKFSFHYEGSLKEGVIPSDLVEDMICKFMNKNHKDMVSNVRFLRTILKDYEEHSLSLSFNSDQMIEEVSYQQSQLSFYEKKEMNIEGSLSIQYMQDNHLSFQFTDSNNMIIDYLNNHNFSDKVMCSFQEIESLRDAKAVQLNQETKKMVEVYRLFYRENPDFSDEKTAIKMQMMFSILSNYYLVSFWDYDFALYGESKIPCSSYLSSIVSSLFPLGEIKDVISSGLREDTKESILLIGNLTRETMKQSKDSEDSLIALSKVMHVKRHVLPSTARIEEISEYSNCSYQDVQSSLELIKKIHKNGY